MIYIRNVVVILILLIGYQVQSQYYVGGQDKGNLKWKEYRTTHFKLIFPQDYEAKAQEVLFELEKAYASNSNWLRKPLKKFPVILHNRQLISNGFVGWAPKRMELYSVPPQSNLSEYWMNHLTQHEFRHIVQFQKMNQGLSTYIAFVFGEQYLAGLLGLYVPFWFIEGDAVVHETVKGNSGRGRSSEFIAPLRTNLLEGEIIRYDQTVFGSLRRMTPNRYELGYHLAAYGYGQYGKDLWEKSLDNTGRIPFYFNPFSNSIKKKSGHYKTGFFNEAIDSLKSYWQYELNQMTLTIHERISAIPKVETNYCYPITVSDSIIIVEKSGLAHINQLVELNLYSDKERILDKIGYRDESGLSHSNGFICWAEIEQDIRWSNSTHTSLAVYSIESERIERFLPKNRYFSPSLSSDASDIVLVEISLLDEHRLVHIDRTSMEVKHVSPWTKHQIQCPVWKDSTSVLYLIVDESGKHLSEWDRTSNTFEIIYSFGFEEIKQIKYKQGKVYFIAGFSGIDNVYQMNLNGEIIKLSSSKYGVFDFDWMGRDLVLSEHSILGYELTVLNDTNILNEIVDKPYYIDNPLIVEASKALSFDKRNVKIDSLQIKKMDYRKWKHLFGFHSWAPAYIDPFDYQIGPGISLMSQNHLSTSILTAGLFYNRNESAAEYQVDYSYTGFFPELSLAYRNSSNSLVYRPKPFEAYDTLRWNRDVLALTMEVPLLFQEGVWYRKLVPSIGTSLIKYNPISEVPESFPSGIANSIDFRLFAYQLERKAPRDVDYKFATILNAGYSKSIGSGLDLGQIYYAQLSQNFPGILKHHRFKITAGIQKRESGELQYSTALRYPRGLVLDNPDQWRKFDMDYHYPLAYPEFAIGPIVYLKRIRGGLFLDNAWYELDDAFYLYSTLGTEIIGDFHLFRFVTPIELGGRLIKVADGNNYRFEFIFNFKFDEI